MSEDPLRFEAGVDEAAASSSDEEDEDSSFHTPQYWNNHFYGDFDEDELYDWYSSCEWLTENVMRVATTLAAARGVDVATLRILDIGCGNSPLLFKLHADHGMCLLTGVDFAEGAIQRCKLHAQSQKVDPAHLAFHVGDATQMHNSADHAYDIVVDKGCLDCFVSGEGHQRIDAYLSEMARVLAPDGLFLLVPVNGADIPELLRSGTVLRDRRAASKFGGGSGAAPPEAWEQSKRIERDTPFVPLLFLQAVRARDEKHLFVCRTSAGGAVVDRLTCDFCGSRYPYPAGVPAECTKCRKRLARFALS